MTKKQWSTIRNFKREEFICKCGCNTENMKYNFMIIIDYIRWKIDSPIKPSSGCRCKKHNENEGGSKTSKHLTGIAVDVLCYGSKAYKIAQEAFAQGLSVGISQKGTLSKRFLHLDKRKIPTIWSY